ncbi:MAG: hypothetical protein V2B19_16755 [Pseudomonadota bacterium]
MFFGIPASRIKPVYKGKNHRAGHGRRPEISDEHARGAAKLLVELGRGAETVGFMSLSPYGWGVMMWGYHKKRRSIVIHHSSNFSQHGQLRFVTVFQIAFDLLINASIAEIKQEIFRGRSIAL